MTGVVEAEVVVGKICSLHDYLHEVLSLIRNIHTIQQEKSSFVNFCIVINT